VGFDKSSLEVKEEKPALRIRCFADQVCKDAGYEGAEALLVAIIEADASLIAYAIQQTAHDEVRMSMAVRRQRISGTVETLESKLPGGKPKTYSDEAVAAAQEWGGKFLAWPLSTRKLLGSATIEDVRAEAEMYEANAQGNARNGRFMRLVEKRLKPGEIVGKVLDDAKLEKLMAKAQSE
jgi:hypothetical protein